MTEIERDMVQKIILISMTAIGAIALVAIIAIACNSIQTNKLISAIYDYDYIPSMTQTNEIEVNK